MNIGRAIGAHLRTTRDTAPSAREALQLAKGGRSERQLARDLGVPRSTLKGWLRGARPKTHHTIVDQVREQVRPQRVQRLAGLTSSIVVSGMLYYAGRRGGKRGEYREISLGQYLDPNVGAQLLAAFEDGASGRAMMAIIHEGITGAPFYSDIFDPDPDPDGGVSGLRFDVQDIQWG